VEKTKMLSVVDQSCRFFVFLHKKTQVSTRASSWQPNGVLFNYVNLR